LYVGHLTEIFMRQMPFSQVVCRPSGFLTNRHGTLNL